MTLLQSLISARGLSRILPSLAIISLAAGLGGCEVKKTQEGEAPKVSVEGGQMPKYDVDAPDVKVEKKEKIITVPDVDVVTPAEKRAGGNVEPGDTKPAPAPATPAPPAP
jgi:hypothetical protein